jgi:pimeloyl-ACP methyl ester carboxylesterase
VLFLDRNDESLKRPAKIVETEEITEHIFGPMLNRILLLHGALGNKSQLIHIESGFRQIAETDSIDLIGHSLENSEEFDMNSLRDQILEYCSHQSCFIFGYSMGGYAALKAAAREHRNIKGIITLGTRLNWSEANTNVELSRLNPVKIEEKVPQFADLLAQRFGEREWPGQMRQTARMMKILSESQALSSEEIAAISCPVLIVRGEHDQMVSREESQGLSEQLDNGRYVELPEVPHSVEKVSAEMLVPYVETMINSVSLV